LLCRLKNPSWILTDYEAVEGIGGSWEGTSRVALTQLRRLRQRPYGAEATMLFSTSNLLVYSERRVFANLDSIDGASR